MIERQVTFPIESDRLWDLLTEPSSASQWFGSRVEWDLRPGGDARFDGEEGRRRGRIDTVAPGEHLAFRWWPEIDESEASDVTYHLEEVDDGTRLTVTEERVIDRPEPGGAATAQCSVAWTRWDARMAAAFCAMSLPVGVVA